MAFSIVSCGRKASCPAANKLAKEVPRENNLPFAGGSIKSLFEGGKKKNKSHNFVIKEHKSNRKAGSLFHNAEKEKSGGDKTGNLFSLFQLEKSTSFSGNLFPSLRNEKSSYSSYGNLFSSLRKEKSSSTSSGNLFSSFQGEKSLNKSGNLFFTQVKARDGARSGNLFFRSYKEQKQYGVKGKEGRMSKKKRRNWQLFRTKNPEEKALEAENNKLFRRSNEVETKNRQRKINSREEGLFQKGVLRN